MKNRDTLLKHVGGKQKKIMRPIDLKQSYPDSDPKRKIVVINVTNVNVV